MSLDNQEVYSPRRQRWTIILVSVATFMVGLDVLVIMTALPTVRLELDGSASDLGWTISAYEIGYAALILVGAALGDRYGRRGLFVAGVVVFTLGSIAAALSTNIELLIAARAFQGLGGGVASALALALISAATPPEKRGAAFGIWGAVTGMAVALGPLIGGAVTQALAWQWIFWVNVPVGIALVVLTLTHIAETKGDPRRVDLPGVVLSTTGVVALAYGLLRGGEAGWTSTSVVAGLVAGVVLLLLFVLWQRRAATPLIPLSMFGNRSFAGGAAASFVLGLVLYGTAFLLAQYFQVAMGSDALDVGLKLLPWVALTPFVAPIAGQLADRIGERPLVVVGFLLFALPLFALAPMATSDASYSAMIGPLLVSGAGVTICFVTIVSAVMKSVPPERFGMAGGVSNTFRQVGAVFGVAITVAVFSSFGGFESRAAFIDGFAPAIIVLAGITLLGVLPAMMIRTYSAVGAATPGPADARRPDAVSTGGDPA